MAKEKIKTINGSTLMEMELPSIKFEFLKFRTGEKRELLLTYTPKILMTI